MLQKLKNYFSKTEILLWVSSFAAIAIVFFVFGEGEALTFVASILGVTAIILNAKGNFIGQCLMIVFSILYGIISYNFSYYGEMITYLGMTMPMAVFSLVTWLRHPYNGKRAEVRVNTLKRKEIVAMFILSIPVTVAFYFVLLHFNTANLIPSTISVSTSFIAVYLTFRRSPYFSVAYAANDIILIVLWSLASVTDIRFVCVTVCFAAFLANDVYGFIGWRKLRRKQGEA